MLTMSACRPALSRRLSMFDSLLLVSLGLGPRDLVLSLVAAAIRIFALLMRRRLARLRLLLLVAVDDGRRQCRSHR
jgi:hypothetical protein